MYGFIFQNTTKIYFGEGQLSHLGEEIKNCGKKVLLVYGGGSIKKTGLYDDVMAELKAAGIEVFELSGVEPNPRLRTVNAGADICKKEGIDTVLAVGGGSTIDCAKAIAAGACYNGNCWDLISNKSPITKALPIFTIVTLSATGSEMDNVSVISNTEINEKRGFNSNLILPKASFLDPTNTYSVNAFQTACGSADIISHILDRYYFTGCERMEMLEGMMETVMKTVIKYAPVAIKEPDNYAARANLMWAASWALNGFLEGGNRQGVPCHAMEHELSAFYDITHGLGLAIIMPRWLKYILDESNVLQFKKFGINVFGIDSSLPDMDIAEKAIEMFSDFLFDTLGLQRTLTEIGIDDKKFKLMAEKACRGGEIKHGKNLKPADVEAIFRMCL